MQENLSTRIKWLFIFSLFGGMIPLIAIGVISYFKSTNALEHQTLEHLISCRNAKKANIEAWFKEKGANIETLADIPQLAEITKEFKVAFKELGAEKTRDLYISKNPFPAGKKSEYIDARDGSNYTKTHVSFHPYLKGYAEQYGFYDIFIIDAETGDVVYSVYKELDFGSNLPAGPYNTSNLAKLFREVNTSAVNAATDRTGFADFEAYAPSNGDPAAFLAHPIYDGNQKVGILAVQLPVSKIDAVMQERSGLGETGETYLVGPDKLLRSNSRFSEKPTIFVQKVDTVAVKKAFEGKTDCELIKDYRGVPVLSAYAPFNALGLNWCVIAEIDEAEADAAIYSLRMWMIIIGIATAVMMGGLAFFVTRNMIAISNVFREMLTELRGSSSQVSAASEQISSSSQSLSEATSEQAASIEETSSTMEEFSSMTTRNADNASEAAKLAAACNGTVENATGTVDSGNKTVGEMDHAMKDISGSSGKIAGIIKIIEEIAFQTNLLALNAAVEAARAGEHGRGFAVVAEEVRNLAHRSSAAAKDITLLIADSVKKAEVGMELVGKTKGVFTTIAKVFSGVVTQVKKVTDLINEISVSSQEQTNGIAQISKAIQQMDQVIQQNAATAEETAAASEELTAQAQGLNAIADNIGVAIGLVEGADETVSLGKPAALAKNVARFQKKEEAQPQRSARMLPNSKEKVTLTRPKTGERNTGAPVHHKQAGASGDGHARKRPLGAVNPEHLIPMTDEEEGFKDFD
ncbi:MAG: methyl-accepting chemotaxis sensory transducer [Candidatus Brocadiaceae bacterium]|nr:methyl-accepting chemotaxis sensory transducer [Candidatus Brocadiaceae bacterium]